MKKFLIFAILIFVLAVFSLDSVFSMGPPPCDGGGSVGVPLDGGLLAILGAAGVAYFAARKKKKE